MEPYIGAIQDKQVQRDYGIQIRFIQDAQEQATRAQKSQTALNKSGSYGVSIRVQGIDGQPYVVLNSNQEGHLQMFEPPPENGSFDQTLSQDGFNAYSGPYAREQGNGFSNNCHFTYPEHQYFNLLKPSPYPQLPMPVVETSKIEVDKKHTKAGSLLNFQKHPEILKPYDPDKDLLKCTSQQSVTSSKLSERDKDKSFHRLPKSEFQDKLGNRPSSSIKPNDEKSNFSKPTTVEDPTKKTAGSASRKIDMLNTNKRCQNNTSPDSEDSRRTRPDLLPLRRQDSTGRGFDASRSRRSSSSTPTSANSDKLNPSYKLWLDDPDEELSAENVNRHENRRYIPFFPGTGRDIDSGPIPGVDELIDKFDGKDGQHRRGRSAKRNRINPEDQKRSRSVDSAFPPRSQDNPAYLDQHSKKLGISNEHLLRPSQLCHKNAASQSLRNPASCENVPSNSTGNLGRCQTQPTENQGSLNYGFMKISGQTEMNGGAPKQHSRRIACKSATFPVGTLNKTEAKKEEITSVTPTKTGKTTPFFFGISKSSDPKQRTACTSQTACDHDVQVTPDLLKDQQMNEETAKQILYNCLKVGSHDDDATKKKVNLVFEKIQTLKSKSADSVKEQKDENVGITSEYKALLEQKIELEKKAVEMGKKADQLQKKLDEQTLKQQSTTEQKDRTKADLKNLQQEMENILEENNRLREQLAKTDKELRNQLEELVQVKMEREQYQSEIRDLQDQLSEMHDELDHAKNNADNEEEKETLIMEMIQAKQQLEEVLLAKDDQQELLKRRERELTALRGVLKEEVSSRDQETEDLKAQHEKEKEKLKNSIEDLVQSKSTLEQEKIVAKQAKNTAEDHAKRLTDENETLKRKVIKLQAEISELNQIISNMKIEENRLKDKLARLEQEKKQLEAALREIGDQEQDISLAKRALESRLEEVQRSLNKRSQEHQELNERLKTETVQRDLLKKTKNEMEAERRQLEKMVEKLEKEMAEMSQNAQRSNLDLRKELDECKEKNRSQLNVLQQQLKTKALEAEKSQLITKKLQDEMRQLREELDGCCQERDEAVLKSQQLKQNISDLELDLESKMHLKDDRIRQIKQMEDKLAEMEVELDEERSNSDLLTDRISRDREQIEQMRNELFQERATRQDLECDKISLERQHKDLKSRIAYLEGSQKQNKEGIVTQLEARIQELEERLEAEERDRSTLQLNNRKLERKAKELILQVDDEHLHLTDQNDQLNLRLKALKRQVDGAEEEIDRLENAKRKLQRELEEQMEANEELQGQMNTLKKDLRRKNSSTKVSSSVLNDFENDYSTDEDSLYDTGFKLSKDSNL
ncbi:cingulin-like protein 1 [Carcharodon carcharias]|uniref:cingulin-like protein 1 n=1 Tax=Carcharodon carcharias TaxID=13397 RepID=UPI001B7DFE5F|nr:cingulin-like protein 1 [Carcharodon carcharias]